jgi:hypothetical protein
MIGVPMRDQRPIHRLYRIDVEVSGRAKDAAIGSADQVGEAHPFYVGRNGGSREPAMLPRRCRDLNKIAPCELSRHYNPYQAKECRCQITR